MGVVGLCMLQLCDIWKWKKMELGAQIASKEAEDVQIEVMVNGVENEEGDILKGNKLHGNFQCSKFKRVDSLDLESSTVSGMATHGSNLVTVASILQLAFQSIGVVYGDIGTSPLYVFASTFTDGIRHPDDVLGALSLIIYSLTLLPLLKYVFIVLWANDNGDGGTFALYSLICRHAKVSVVPNQQAEDRELSSYKLAVPSRELKRALKIKEALEKSNAAKTILLILALLGTSMVIGDGVLTPCISVLSAVQGIKQVDKSISQEAVAMISVAILVMLFSVQRFGTRKVGYSFAPAILIWYSSIAFIGIYNIVKYDTTVFRAFYPKYIFEYFRRDSQRAWISLGGIVLCVTGTEAMFADLGHFSVRSIQIAFTGIVYPALICAYVGQAAYLKKFPENVSDTFYKSTPSAIYWPMFAVAIVASIIASQAMISATFSIIKQSMSLGCFPRVTVVHTSSKHEGQVYIPEINYILMLACVIVTISFQDTTKIGNAYGIAVVGVMIVTSSFLTLVMLMIWQTHLLLIVIFVTVFGAIEFTYFSAVLYKFPQGGYLPTAFAAVLLFVMYVWHYVHVKRYAYEVEHKVSTEHMLSLGSSLDVTTVPGIGLLYTELAQGVPAIFEHFMRNLPARHSVLVFVCVKYLPVNTIPAEERFVFRRIGPKGHKIYRCVARYGYRDTRTGNVEFENQLLESLREFIQFDYICRNDMNKQSQHEGNSSNSGESIVNIDAASETEDMKACSMVSVKEELEFLENAKESGVVYLLGDSEVIANKDSSLFKRFIVNFAYNILRRNCRKGQAALEIPHKNLLQVGMTYYI
eukprot:PITA_00857